MDKYKLVIKSESANTAKYSERKFDTIYVDKYTNKAITYRALDPIEQKKLAVEIIKALAGQ